MLGLQASVSAQSRTIADSLTVPFHIRKHFGRTSGEILGINLGVWAFDRFVIRGDYARINWQTLNGNFIRGFTWDNDQIGTNLLGHPCHGSIYYNAARSNGYGYAAAFASTAAGSLNWEMFLENERPSINDIFATTVGGTVLGEMFYRLSDRILDGGTTGGQRLAREFASLLINPARGLTRILNGDMWKTHQTSGKQFDIPCVSVNISAGIRRLKLKDKTADEGSGFSTGISVEYGERHETGGMKPYDYFTVEGRFNIQKLFKFNIRY